MSVLEPRKAGVGCRNWRLAKSFAVIIFRAIEDMWANSGTFGYARRFGDHYAYVRDLFDSAGYGGFGGK